LHLATLQDAIGRNPRAREAIHQLQALSRQMSKGIYRLVRDLRPAQLDDLGLVAALQFLADEESRRVGIHAHVEVSGRRKRLDPLVETVLFRVAQEALTNVVRHAAVLEASVELFFFPEMVTLRVCDQGVGFDPHAPPTPPHGWGLAGMRERVESVGGELRLVSSPGKGTIVEVDVPLPAMESVEGTAIMDSAQDIREQEEASITEVE
jgi:signal transduction histidine kinase